VVVGERAGRCLIVERRQGGRRFSSTNHRIKYKYIQLASCRKPVLLIFSHFAAIITSQAMNPEA
jgi:hypothetical protein